MKGKKEDIGKLIKVKIKEIEFPYCIGDKV